MIKTFILFLLAYLLGSIPSGVWIGKLFYKKDIRQYGSGNSGATNAFRVLGKKPGFFVALLDVLKGTAAALLPVLFHVPISGIIIGAAAIIGHVYPIFAQFKGGKAVATSAGVALAYNPFFLLAAVAVFLVILYTSSMVSLASVGTFIIASVAILWIPDWYFRGFIWLITALIVFRHTSNMKRILKGTENRVPFGLRKREN